MKKIINNKEENVKNNIDNSDFIIGYDIDGRWVCTNILPKSTTRKC